MTLEVHRKEHHSHPEIFSYTLKIGEWKKMFRTGYYKTLIAEALNCTVYKGEFKHTIVGYLISDRRLCLVLRIEQKKIRKMLQHIYENLRDEIGKSLDAIPDTDFENLPENLFTEFELKNTHLVRLITGRQVRLPYSDPQLERLKDRIRNYPFCSAIDYGGAEGPVLVKVMKKKDWDAIDHSHKTLGAL